jgi:hypothetical protein
MRTQQFGARVLSWLTSLANFDPGKKCSDAYFVTDVSATLSGATAGLSSSAIRTLPGGINLRKFSPAEEFAQRSNEVRAARGC